MNKLAIAALASLLMLFTGTVARAQNARAKISNTPIRSEATLASPIVATLKEGGRVDVVDREGDWYRVVVPDEQGRTRTGYVLANLLAIVDTDRSLALVPAPTDRPPRPAAEGLPIAPTLAEISQREEAVKRMQVLKAEVDALQANLTELQSGRPAGRPRHDAIPKPVSQHFQPRDGFWFNAGLGFGSFSCDGCVRRFSGGSGGVSLGGTINKRLLLGGGSSGYYRSRSFTDGGTLTAGTIDARLRVYPILTSGFFVTGGLGLGHISDAFDTEYGLGAVLGLGWDIRVRSNLSLTPFWNGIGISTSNGSVGVGQLGLGITIH